MIIASSHPAVLLPERVLSEDKRMLGDILAIIETQLNAYCSLHDRLTDLLRLWHRGFKEALYTSSPPEDILTIFGNLLTEILTDPVSFLFERHLFLDDESILTEDGFVCGWTGSQILNSPYSRYPLMEDALEWLKIFEEKSFVFSSLERSELNPLLDAITNDRENFFLCRVSANLSRLEQDKRKLDDEALDRIWGEQIEDIAARIQIRILDKKINECEKWICFLRDKKRFGCYRQEIHFSQQQKSGLHQLSNELKMVDRLIELSGMEDEKTLEIQQWSQSFQRILEEKPAHWRESQKKYIDVLQKLLIDDSFSDVYIAATENRDIAISLDEDPVLGSNGKTYNRKSLYLHLSLFKEEDREIVLQHATQTLGFTIQTHPIARHMVKWLKERNPAFFETEMMMRIETGYHQLESSGKLPLIRTLMSARYQEIEWEQQEVLAKQRDHQKKQRMELVSGSIEELIKRDPFFDSLFRELDVESTRLKERVSALGCSSADQCQMLEKQTEKLGKISEEQEEKVKLNRAKLEILKSQIAETREANEQLNRKLGELEQQIQENKEKKKNGIFTQIMITAVCAMVTYGASSYLNGAFVVTPSAGGATGSLAIPIIL